MILALPITLHLGVLPARAGELPAPPACEPLVVDTTSYDQADRIEPSGGVACWSQPTRGLGKAHFKFVGYSREHGWEAWLVGDTGPLRYWGEASGSWVIERFELPSENRMLTVVIRGVSGHYDARLTWERLPAKIISTTTLDGAPLTSIRRGEPFAIQLEGIAADEDPIVSVGTVLVPNDAWDGSRLEVRVPLRAHSGYVQVSKRGHTGTTIPLADPAPGTGHAAVRPLDEHHVRLEFYQPPFQAEQALYTTVDQALASCGIQAPWEVTGRVDTMGLLALRFDIGEFALPAEEAVLALIQCIQAHGPVDIVDHAPRSETE